MVRYAESANEKAARLTRRQQQAAQQAQRANGYTSPSDLLANLPNLGLGLPPEQLQEALGGLNLNGFGGQGMGGGSGGAPRGPFLPPPPPILNHLHPPPVQSSVCIKGERCNSELLPHSHAYKSTHRRAHAELSVAATDPLLRLDMPPFHPPHPAPHAAYAALLTSPPAPPLIVLSPPHAPPHTSHTHAPPAGTPNNADRLWIYENFARFGAISGMRILIDESTGLCNGTR